MKLIYRLLFILFLFQNTVNGQSGFSSVFGKKAVNETSRGFRSREFSIPTAPVFSLLNADPSLVTMPGVIRDFKVDWSMKTYKLTPNISLEATPVWTLLYDEPGYKSYQKAGTFMQRISTLDLSLGTIQSDSSKQVAWAVKLNLFSGKDFYENGPILREVLSDLEPLRDSALQQIENLKTTTDTARDDEAKFRAAWQLYNLEQEVLGLETLMEDRTNLARGVYMQRFWNSASVDFCFGKVYNYGPERIDSLRLRREGFAMWISAGAGFGKNWFISSLMRYSSSSKNSSGFQTGFNLRYGGIKYNFFTELVQESGQYQQTLFNTRDRSPKINIGYGGTFRLSPAVMLSFCVRTIYDENFIFRNFLPIANLACLMR